MTKKHLRTLYGIFVVLITPLSIPLIVWTIYMHMVPEGLIRFTLIFSLLTAFGVTLGYHRFLAHTSFQMHPWLQYLLLTLGAMAFQGPPVVWASLHLQHHRYADKPGDPHSPRFGFWHAHCLWVLRDFSARRLPGARRIFSLPSARWVTQHYLAITLLSLLIPTLLFGAMGFLWAGVFRIFLVSHCLFLANSLAHLWGKQDNKLADNSRNNFLTALLCLGEGWHNNHHADPKSAFHGWQWWQLDLTGIVIWLFEKCGWIWAVQRPVRMTAK